MRLMFALFILAAGFNASATSQAINVEQAALEALFNSAGEVSVVGDMESDKLSSVLAASVFSAGANEVSIRNTCNFTGSHEHVGCALFFEYASKGEFHAMIFLYRGIVSKETGKVELLPVPVISVQKALPN